jgi:predicted O-methyltransferase YrrM
MNDDYYYDIDDSSDFLITSYERWAKAYAERIARLGEALESVKSSKQRKKIKAAFIEADKSYQANIRHITNIKQGRY